MRYAAAVLSVLFGLGVLTAAGTGAWAGGHDASASPSKAENAGEKKTDKKSNKKDSHAMTTAPSYVGIEPIYTTILDRDSVAGTLMLGIGLDVADPQLHDEVVAKLPILRDLYVRTMLSYTAVSIRSWRQPNVEDIAARLQAVTDRKLKRQGVRVLLAQVAIRMNQ